MWESCQRDLRRSLHAIVVLGKKEIIAPYFSECDAISRFITVMGMECIRRNASMDLLNIVVHLNCIYIKVRAFSFVKKTMIYFALLNYILFNFDVKNIVKLI